MIKLIVGNKGSGKTKTLISMTNEAVSHSAGNVVCLEKGLKLTYDITHKARLVDTDEYAVEGFDALYGFLAGLMAGNYDITHLFIDGTFKIGKIGDVEKDYEGFAYMVQCLAKLNTEAQIVFTVSCDASDLPVSVNEYIVK